MNSGARGGWNPFLRFPLASLVITGVLAVPLLLRLPAFRVTAETEALLSGDQRNQASYELVREILGETEAVVVSLELTNLFTVEGLETVRAFSDAFERQPEVIEIKSLTHAVRPIRRGLRFEMVPLVPAGPLDSSTLAELRAFCLSHPLAKDLLVSADGMHTLVTIHYAARALTADAQDRFRTRLEATLAPFRAAGLRFRVLALPLIEHEIRSALRRDLTWFVPAAAGVVVGVLWLTFRSAGLVAFVLVTQLGTLALLPGVVQWTGFELNVFSVILLPLVTGIHLTLLMHLLTALQRARAGGLAIEAALADALRVVAKPAVASTLTTVLALLSLAASDLEPVRQFGRLGAVCLMTVHAVTFGPTVACLRLVDLGSGLKAMPRANPFAIGLVAFTVRRRPVILFGAALAALVALGGIALLRTDVRVLEMLNRRSPTRQALEELDRAYGGINVVQIALDSGRTNGVNDPEFLKYLDQLQRFTDSQPEPTGVFSYAQLLAIVNQIWEGGRPEALRLPQNPWLITLFSTAIRTYQFPFLVALADTSFRQAQLIVRTRDMPARGYLELIQRVVAYAEAHKPSGVGVSAAQGIHSILEADRRILRSQATSVGIALVVIALALAALWRSGRLALVGVITNTVPVALALAAAGYAQVPLNSINVMVGALALGIAQDDTIHFVSHWRDCVRAGVSTTGALRETLEVKGRPIIWTTVILVAVFALFGLSSFPPVVQFGLLLAVAFVAAQSSLLLLLPVGLSTNSRTGVTGHGTACPVRR